MDQRATAGRQRPAGNLRGRLAGARQQRSARGVEVAEQTEQQRRVGQLAQRALFRLLQGCEQRGAMLTAQPAHHQLALGHLV
jgi:hypothetical protein